MKNLILIFFVFASFTFSQSVKFVFLSNIGISNTNIELAKSVFDSVNSNNDINFIVISGNLTKDQQSNEFKLLNELVSKSKIPVYLIPGIDETFRLGDTWLNYFLEVSDDRFSFEKDGFVFIGFNPNVPFRKIYYFTNDILVWLEKQLSTYSLDKEKYIFLPEDVKTKCLNWNKFISLIEKKNVKLLLFGGKGTVEFFSEDGIRAFQNNDGFILQKNKIGFNIIKTNKDSVIFYQKELGKKEQIVNTFDKSVQINTSKIYNQELTNDSTKIELQEEYNSTLYSGLTYWNGKIYFATQEGIVNCIDSVGKFLWDYDSYGNIFSKPVIADGILADITYQGDLFSISAITGEPIQSIGFDDQFTSDILLINYSGSKELMMPKLTKSKAALVFGSLSGKVYCYDLETLQEYWVNSSAKGSIISPLLEYNNKIYFISRDGFLYCIDSRDGILIWRWKPSRDIDVIDQTLITNGKNLFVVTSNNVLYSIDMLLGKYTWEKDKLNVLASVGISTDKKRIYVKSELNKIYILSSETGVILKDAKFELGFDYYPTPILNTDEATLFSSKGSIYTMDNKYNIKKLITTGFAPINQITKIGQSKFLTSDLDCQIIILTTQ
ncbi:PQQ-binding-like beta-propeller repeat protein [Melioribacteraceae bacterium 4301-Me]|uniref:outer membrane protein assembly factor BamB family protein n=1 Tax=Pyranulibacter aquaticus TaxID=3163344 RepID=UPI0035972E5D